MDDGSIVNNVDGIWELSRMNWSLRKFCISKLIPHKSKVMIKLLMVENFDHSPTAI
jgi:hypothetical protein